jgi:Mitochondrial ATP synthase B chain precursor (ATP-synt_B)
VNVSKAWFALPLGIAVAVPMLKYEWYVVNEETQLAACFIAFCVAFYSGVGDMIHNTLTAPGLAILKEHNELEQKLIDALEQELVFYKAQGNKADDFEAINNIRAKAYADLNAAGMIQPQHDLKVQMEKVVALIAIEETRVAEGAKALLMESATASVKSQFNTSKDLKKAALDAAISKIKGTAKPGDDPVTATFIKFFKDTGAAAAKVDSNAESLALRASIISKMNTVCKNEKYMFQFDETGKPVMLV